MKARIVGRKWVQEWFDERQCNHMPSLTLGYDGTLLATWCGGMLGWNGDAMGKDCVIWLSRLEKGADAWSVIEGVGTDIRYACHNGSFFRNQRGEILLIFGKFLDAGRNDAAWCGGRDKLWSTRSKDGGLTWHPAKETNIPMIGHPACDGLLLENGDMLMACSSIEAQSPVAGGVEGRGDDVGERHRTRARAGQQVPAGDVPRRGRLAPCRLHAPTYGCRARDRRADRLIPLKLAPLAASLFLVKCAPHAEKRS